MELSKNQRISNLELLRIIAMIFIVAHHWAGHGFEGVVFSAQNMNNLPIYLFLVLGKIGVDVFILISAYFMINSKFTFRKLLNLGGEVYFYSILFLVIFAVFLNPPFPIRLFDIGTSLLPISHSAYWFVTDYIVLMLLSPFLNKFIKGLSKKTFLRLLVLSIFLWSIYSTFTGKSFGYSELLWFVVLYFIGSFIRLHLDIGKISSKKLMAACLISFVLMYVGCYLLEYLNLTFNVTANRVYEFSFEYSIFILIISISLFLIFLKQKPFYNRYINYIAGSVLGVYLIHDNLFVRQYLWKYILHNHQFYSSPNLVLFAILSIALIYLTCTGIDIIRRLTVEKLWMRIVDGKLIGIPKWVESKLVLLEKRIQFYLK